MSAILDSDVLNGMELTVHIGTGKTGSSSIQRALANSPAALAAQGIAYFGLMFESNAQPKYPWQKAGGWPALVQQGRPDAQAQLAEVLTGALQAAEANGIRRAVWSNESIFGSDALVLPVLKTLQASGVRVRVIVYVRRHDAWIKSAYLQWGVKHKTYPGPVKSFRDWYSGHKPHFSSGLAPWLEAQLSDLTVRNFDACGDVVRDFLSYMAIDEKQVKIVRENETPNAVALALWAIYNSQVEGPVLPADLQGLLRRSGLLNAPAKGSNWASLLPTEQDIEAVALDSRRDRERLDEILARHGQAPIDTSPLKHKDMTVTQDDINAALLTIIKQQGDQIQMLIRRLPPPDPPK
jgi:hypothetical protein